MKARISLTLDIDGSNRKDIEHTRDFIEKLVYERLCTERHVEVSSSTHVLPSITSIIEQVRAEKWTLVSTTYDTRNLPRGWQMWPRRFIKKRYGKAEVDALKKNHSVVKMYQNPLDTNDLVVCYRVPMASRK